MHIDSRSVAVARAREGLLGGEDTHLGRPETAETANTSTNMH